MTRRRKSAAEVLKAAKLAEEKAVERAIRKRRQVQKLESVGRSRERKLDTRRKIIVGAFAWEHREHDALFKRVLMKLLDDYLWKDDERALVELPALSAEEKQRVRALEEARALEKKRNRRRKQP